MTKYTFEFDGNDAQLIVDALGKLPYFQVRDLIYNIHVQVANQTKVEEIAAVSPKEKPAE